MRRLPVCKLLVLTFCCFTIGYVYFINIPKSNVVRNDTDRSLKPRIVLSFVVCDSRFNESLNVIKSIVLFTKSPVYFVIFADDLLRVKFNQTLSSWRSLLKNQLDFELHRINFPEEHEEEWLNLFSKCAAQRLFIPKLIPHIDAAIYVDTDTLFLGPVDELWHAFSQFNSSQISAMTVEDDNPNVSWYPRFAKHPFYGKYESSPPTMSYCLTAWHWSPYSEMKRVLGNSSPHWLSAGLNSGVMLMNLTRMREFGWVDYVTPIMLKWKLYIPWGDQDIINIIFHYHERAVYLLSCRYNYRSDQCMYGDACADATSRGVFVLHGSRRIFHNQKQPTFQAIYNAIAEYDIGADPMTVIVQMEKYLSEVPQSNCGNLKDAFLKVPVKTLSQMHTQPVR